MSAAGHAMLEDNASKGTLSLRGKQDPGGSIVLSTNKTDSVLLDAFFLFQNRVLQLQRGLTVIGKNLYRKPFIRLPLRPAKQAQSKQQITNSQDSLHLFSGLEENKLLLY